MRHVSTIGNKLLNSNTSFICPHSMANFSLLAAEIGSGVLGIPANFNEFRVLASLMERRRSPEANQTLHNVWPSPGCYTIIYIYTSGGSCPLKEFRHVQNSVWVQVLCSLFRVTILPGKSWNLVRPFSRPGKSWKTAMVMESHGK